MPTSLRTVLSRCKVKSISATLGLLAIMAPSLKAHDWPLQQYASDGITSNCLSVENAALIPNNESLNSSCLGPTEQLTRPINALVRASYNALQNVYNSSVYLADVARQTASLTAEASKSESSRTVLTVRRPKVGKPPVPAYAELTPVASEYCLTYEYLQFDIISRSEILKTGQGYDFDVEVTSFGGFDAFASDLEITLESEFASLLATISETECWLYDFVGSGYAAQVLGNRLAKFQTPVIKAERTLQLDDFPDLLSQPDFGLDSLPRYVWMKTEGGVNLLVPEGMAIMWGTTNSTGKVLAEHSAVISGLHKLPKHITKVFAERVSNTGESLIWLGNQIHALTGEKSQASVAKKGGPTAR